MQFLLVGHATLSAHNLVVPSDDRLGDFEPDGHGEVEKSFKVTSVASRGALRAAVTFSYIHVVNYMAEKLEITSLY